MQQGADRQVAERWFRRPSPRVRGGSCQGCRMGSCWLPGSRRRVRERSCDETN